MDKIENENVKEIEERSQQLVRYGSISSGTFESVVQPLLTMVERLQKELKRKSLLLEHALELIEDREKENEQLQSASQLQSDVYRKLELRHREQTNELKRLKTDRSMQYKLFNEELDKSKELREENEHLRNQLKEAVKVLEWYGEKRNYEGGFSPKGNGIQEAPIVFDEGERACQALSHIQGKVPR